MVLAISIVHPRDTMLLRNTTIRTTFRAVSVACCPNAKGGATLVRDLRETWAPEFWPIKSSLGLVHLAEGLGGPCFCKWLGR